MNVSILESLKLKNDRISRGSRYPNVNKIQISRNFKRLKCTIVSKKCFDGIDGLNISKLQMPQMSNCLQSQRCIESPKVSKVQMSKDMKFNFSEPLHAGI